MLASSLLTAAEPVLGATAPSAAAAPTLTERLVELWNEALTIWLGGGWAMIAIAVIALVMFALGVNVWLRLNSKGRVRERVWRRWIDDPTQRRGAVGRLLDTVDGAHSVHESAMNFDHVRANEAAPFERDLRVMKICVSAAPLVGLLGTVTGMLTTFGALASGSGGEKTMSMVAGGISEALITTETGLVVAIPGLFFQYQLARKFEGYKAFLATLETVFNQILYRRLRATQRATPHDKAAA